MLAKRCKGTRISIEHYFLANPNGGPTTKWAENLGYCGVCFSMIPNAKVMLSGGGWEKKYPKRNDRAEIMPSKDYE